MLKILQNASILTQDTFDAIKYHQNLGYLLYALEKFHSAGILSSANFDTIKDHANPLDLARLLITLNSEKILNDVTLVAIKNHQDPYYLSLALTRLANAHILTESNFYLIKDHRNLVGLADALGELDNGGALNQATFDGLIVFSKESSKPNSPRFFPVPLESNLAIKYLKNEYEKNGGESSEGGRIFGTTSEYSAPTCAAIISRPKEEALKSGESGASEKTLRAIGLSPLPSANQSHHQNFGH